MGKINYYYGVIKKLIKLYTDCRIRNNFYFNKYNKIFCEVNYSRILLTRNFLEILTPTITYAVSYLMF